MEGRDTIVQRCRVLLCKLVASSSSGISRTRGAQLTEHSDVDIANIVGHRPRNTGLGRQLLPALLRKGVRDPTALGSVMHFSWVSTTDMSLIDFAAFDAALNFLAKDESLSTLTLPLKASLLLSSLKNGFDMVSASLITRGFLADPVGDALCFAASGGCAVSIAQLCASATAGAIDFKYASAQTALHIACSFGHAQTALALLPFVTDWVSFDSFNSSPMAHAKRFGATRGMDAVVTALKAKGATH